MAGRARPHLVDGPLCRLLEGARSALRPGLRFVRALSLRALRHHLEDALQRAAADEAHPASVARRRRAEECPADGDRESCLVGLDRAHDHDLWGAVARG